MAAAVSVIDVPGVLAELEELRAEREAHSTTTAFNLIAFFEGDNELRKVFLERIREFEQRNPLRTIVLTCDENGMKVEREHVQVPSCDLGASQLKSIAHDLCVPGVRTVLMWAGTRVSDPRFTALCEMSDITMLFTSRTATSETQSLADVVALLGGPLEHKVRDVAFLRLLPWQELVAQLFDDEQLTPELQQIEAIEIGSGTSSEAYYFAGWLASRLNWQPCGAHEFCNESGKTIRVTLTQEGPPRRLQAVRLNSAAERFEAAVQAENDEMVCLRVDGPKARWERCVPLQNTDMVTLVEHAIFVQSDQSMYLDTLRMVGRLLEHLS